MEITLHSVALKNPEWTSRVNSSIRENLGIGEEIPLLYYLFDVREGIDPLPRYINGVHKSRLTGLDEGVRDVILRGDYVGRLFIQIIDLISSRNLPTWNIIIGCRSGKHRSVALAEEMARHLRERYPDYQIKTHHPFVKKREEGEKRDPSISSSKLPSHSSPPPSPHIDLIEEAPSPR